MDTRVSPRGHETHKDTRVPDVRARLRARLVLARGPSHLEKELTGEGGVSSQVTPGRWGDLSQEATYAYITWMTLATCHRTDTGASGGRIPPNYSAGGRIRRVPTVTFPTMRCPRRLPTVPKAADRLHRAGNSTGPPLSFLPVGRDRPDGATRRVTRMAGRMEGLGWPVRWSDSDGLAVWTKRLG